MSKDELVAYAVGLQAENAVILTAKAAAEAKALGYFNELEKLKRLIYGAKSERFVPVDPNQLQLDFGQAMEVARQEAEKEKITYVREKKKRKETPVREPIPAHFPRNVIQLEPLDADGEKIDTTGMKCIGEEVTEELEYHPEVLFVNQYRRKKYVANTSDEKTEIIIAKLPCRPIEKGIPGPGLLAWIIIEKFLWHIPFYRQSQRFASKKIKIPDSTMGEWFARCCELLEPLYEELIRLALASGYVQADETPLKVLDKDSKNGVVRGYHWVYHAPVERIVVFDYRPGRSKAGPARMLVEYKGWLQTDAYAAYDNFEEREGVFLVGCLAHARRKFEEALGNDKARAEWMLGKMRELYAVEREAREGKLDHAQRLDLRAQKSRPLFGQIAEWVLENQSQVLPQSAIGKAIYYLIGRFEYIARILEDGQLEIDNNLVENAIRPIALGRKNYLFAGSHAGAKNAAIIYSLLGTAKMNGLDPFEWLRNTLAVIAGHPINKIAELLPIPKEVVTV